MLPEKWFIRVTKDNYSEIDKWKRNTKWTDSARTYEAVCSDGDGVSIETAIYFKFKEICFEDFKKYVMEKEIIRYKLIKPEYEKAALNIAIKDDCGWSENAAYNFTKDSNAHKRLKEAGVLDLWFEPVYKEEFKVGDYVVIKRKDSWSSASGCSNVPEQGVNYTGKITNLVEKDDHTAVTVCNKGFDLNKSKVRYATENEILECLKEEFIKRTGIDVGSKITEENVVNIVTNFILFKKDSSLNRGLNSSFTDNWFKRNPNEKYQLGIKAGTSTFSPDCTLAKNDVVVNEYTATYSGNYVHFGCAKIDIDLFKDLIKIIETAYLGNRNIKSVTIGKGTFTIDQIKQIVSDYDK